MPSEQQHTPFISMQKAIIKVTEKGKIPGFDLKFRYEFKKKTFQIFIP